MIFEFFSGTGAPSLTDICVCGHSSLTHVDKACYLRPNCKCNWMRPIFEVLLSDNFLEPHENAPKGHALIKGVLAESELGRKVRLARTDLGKKPACHKCSRLTECLMPVHVNIGSKERVTDVSKGVMSRLWCRICVETDGGTYDQTIETAIRVGLLLDNPW